MTQEELKEKTVKIINEWHRFQKRDAHGNTIWQTKDSEKLANALISAGITQKQKAKWLWDDEEDEPKCSCCGGRAEYTPLENKNGAKMAFITLSFYCPHCGAEMQRDMYDDEEEDMEEKMSVENLNKEDLLWVYEMAVGHAKFEIERLKAENTDLRERLGRAIKELKAREQSVVIGAEWKAVVTDEDIDEVFGICNPDEEAENPD